MMHQNHQLTEAQLFKVTGASSQQPYNCGSKVDQYAVRVGRTYYYHYQGGGHDQWLIIYVTAVKEEPKHILWFTERFAYVTYTGGLTGKLPLDTGDVYEYNGPAINWAAA